MESLIGRTLGQYQIAEEIGRGGMAVVYRAYQTSLQRNVAIKVLPAMMASDQTFIARFRREATLVASLAHPGVLPVYDFGEQDGLLYIVMMYVGGGTLRERMHERLALPAVSAIVTRLLDALDYAHRRGIVHRDVKPSNVLMARPEWPLLSDFGIARLAEHSGLTATSLGLGTPEYVSPEQAHGYPVDARSDLYSVGVILFELLAGRAPFVGQTPIAIVQQHVTQPPPPLASLRGDLPAGVEEVVARALAKDPAARFQAATELRDAVTAVLSSRRASPLPEGEGPRVAPPPISDTPTRPDHIPLATIVMPGDSKPGVREAPTVIKVQGASGQAVEPRPGRAKSGRLIPLLALGGGVSIGLLACLGVAGLSGGRLPSILQPFASSTPTPTVTATALPTATATATPIPPGGLVFRDDFRDPQFGDWSGTNDQGQVVVANGSLQLISKQGNDAGYRTRPRTGPPVDDFALEAKFTKINGPDNFGYGLVFRDDDQGTFAIFEVTGNGSFRLSKVAGAAGVQPIVNWQTARSIAHGNGVVNVLRVEAKGGHLRLIVNGELVSEADAQLPASGGYGLLTGTTGLHVAVSSFAIEKR